MSVIHYISSAQVNRTPQLQAVHGVWYHTGDKLWFDYASLCGLFSHTETLPPEFSCTYEIDQATCEVCLENLAKEVVSACQKTRT